MRALRELPEATAATVSLNTVARYSRCQKVLRRSSCGIQRRANPQPGDTQDSHSQQVVHLENTPPTFQITVATNCWQNLCHELRNTNDAVTMRWRVESQTERKRRVLDPALTAIFHWFFTLPVCRMYVLMCAHAEAAEYINVFGVALPALSRTLSNYPHLHRICNWNWQFHPHPYQCPRPFTIVACGHPAWRLRRLYTDIELNWRASRAGSRAGMGRHRKKNSHFISRIS